MYTYSHAWNLNLIDANAQITCVKSTNKSIIAQTTVNTTIQALTYVNSDKQTNIRQKNT